MTKSAPTRAHAASPWVVGAAFSVVAAFVTLWFPYVERRDALAALARNAADEARLIAYTIGPAVDFGDAQIITDAFRGAQGNTDFVGISATGSDGREVARLGRVSVGENGANVLVTDASIDLADGAAGRLRLVLGRGRIERQSAKALLVSGAMGATIAVLGILVTLWVARSIRQITALLEENQRARATAEEANLVKSRFLANMSHEMRTPLNGVLGLSDVLSRRRLDGDSTALVRSIERSGRRLLALVNDLLDLSRVEAGRLELESEPMDVEAAAAAVIEMFAPACRNKGIELVLEVDADVPRSVMGDRLRFEQILMNLVGNAVKFTAKGAVTLSFAWRDGSLRVSVEDDGIGIAPDKCAKIFDAFSQADTSTTRRYGGSGLGLAISRQFVRQMGGDLHVASELGSGSTFSFAIPCASVAPAPAPAPIDGGGGRALVVARAPKTRALLTAHAVRCGYLAEEADVDDVLGMSPATTTPALVVWDSSAASPSAEQCTQLAKAIDEGRLRLVVHAPPFDEGMLWALAAIILPVGFSREAFEQAAVTAHGAVTANKAASERAPKLDAHVLLVEDDETNQLVASTFLAELGLTVEIAGNGLRAVARATSGAHFDAILMDCQMPELDGYEATRRIRAWEGEIGRARVPIVACTAHALPAERAQAIAVGMDGYLTKPLTLESVRGAVSKLSGARGVATAERGESSSLGVLGQIGRDPALAARLRDAFARGSSTGLAALANALAANDWGAAAQHAHKLKGSCLALGATRAAELAVDLEVRVKAQDVAAAAKALVCLEIAVEDVRTEFDEAAGPSALG